MLSAITKYMPRWLMAIIATALVLATVVGSNQESAEAIDPADTDTVYIADGTNFADALMGATIASLNTSPMLGVAGTNGGDTIPGDTAEELDRLTDDKNDPLDTIYVFGGTSAVSSSVFEELDQWANDVQRIEGDSRWGTYEAISQMLPSAIDEAVHAQEADHATEADNADTLDGNHSSDFLGATDKAADSDLLDGIDSTVLVPKTTLLTWDGSATVNFSSGAFTFKKVRDIGSMTKDSADTDVRLDLNTHFIGTGGLFCEYQLRIDGVSAAGGTSPDRTSIIGGADNDRQPLTGSITFEGLSAGSHDISLWVRSDSGDCTENDGNHTRQVLVTEELTR